jgi:hypothetical protein
MARRRSTDRKLRTREHVLADLSANYVEKQSLLCGFTAEHVRYDYGIDLMVQTFNRWGEVENGWIPFQLKATDRIRLVDAGRSVSCRIERADLRHWLNEESPVILALYDAQADIAYWLYVRRHFAQMKGFDINRTGERVSVSIPRDNLLNRKAMRILARAKNALSKTDERAFYHGF